jgi:hypothetical protein
MLTRSHSTNGASHKLGSVKAVARDTGGLERSLSRSLPRLLFCFLSALVATPSCLQQASCSDGTAEGQNSSTAVVMMARACARRSRAAGAALTGCLPC